MRLKKTLAKSVWLITDAVKNSLVYHYYYSLPVDGGLVFVDPRNGKELASNMFRIVLEIRKLYADRYRIVIAVQPDKEKSIRKLLDNYSLTDVELCRYRTNKYFKLLFSAKYLFSDVTLSPKYVKKEGQVYVNTWHGTPLKCLGRYDLSGADKIDNVQRNLFNADYLLFPSRYCLEKIADSYSLNGLYSGKVLMCGYPRNAVFFDNEAEGLVREKYGLTGKKVYIYMPTYREGKTGPLSRTHAEILLDSLKAMDTVLDDSEILYVKLHNLVQNELRSYRVNDFKHIRPFPDGQDTYEFLCAVDCLITDYSSVFYDFAVSGKKIIRYIYDEDEYCHERSIYDQPVKLPFTEVRNIDELTKELRNEKNYSDKEFREVFCQYDSADAAEKLVRHIMEGVGCCEELSIREPDQEYVWFYSGVPLKNGINSSAVNLLKNLNDGRKYIVSFPRKATLETASSDVQLLPEGAGVYEVEGVSRATFSEQFAKFLHYKLGINGSRICRKLRHLYEREYRRHFYGTPFSAYIQFSGYDGDVINTVLYSDRRRAIFLHNDMVKEYTEKRNCNPVVLRDAYKGYDYTAVVSRALAESAHIMSGGGDNTVVVHNYQDFDSIVRRGESEIRIQNDTLLWTKAGCTIEDFLKSHKPVFITIGRFSVEKNHPLLIDAFSKFHKDVKESGLIIIGGYGDRYDDTVSYADRSSAAEDIMIIRSVANPMPVLKRCDLFVLSSQYEGMPMVFLEAAALGVPSIAVNTTGSKEFMEDFGGKTVSYSVEGLVSGMLAFMNHEVPMLKIVPEEYNRNSLEEFERLFQ